MRVAGGDIAVNILKTVIGLARVTVSTGERLRNAIRVAWSADVSEGQANSSQPRVSEFTT